MTELRVAGPRDLAGVTRVFLDCWRRSYLRVLPEPAITAMTDERAEAIWRRALASSDGRVVVAESDGDLVGVTRYTAGLTEGAVHSLYVSPDAQGMGLGSLLLDDAVATFRSEHLASAALWVFAANSAALGFYGSRGWLPDGGTRVEEGFGEPELRLRKALP